MSSQLADGDVSDLAAPPVVPRSVGAPTPPVIEFVGVGKVTRHQMKTVADVRGDLTVGEFDRDIPFIPKRYFMVFDVPAPETRGEHAHHACHQFLICVRGSCAVIVDDGRARREVGLDHVSVGLYLPPLTWGVQYKYSPDAVLLVFASHHYDAADYIRDYAAFKTLVGVGVGAGA